MKKKVTLSGFPEVGVTAKWPLPGKGDYAFIKLGTGELGSEDFEIEIETNSVGMMPTDEDSLAALGKWTEEVCEVQLGRLREFVADVESEFGRIAQDSIRL